MEKVRVRGTVAGGREARGPDITGSLRAGPAWSDLAMISMSVALSFMCQGTSRRDESTAPLRFRDGLP
jgi:hypothetical protein